MYSEYTKFVTKFPCYTEFNFVDLYTWDIEEETEVSMLNGNLVLKRPNYLNRQKSISFLGSNDVRATLDILLDYAEQLSGRAELESVPDIVLSQCNLDFLAIAEDDDSADYILDTQEQISLNGSRYADRRTKLRRFIKFYGDIVDHRLLDPVDTQTSTAIWQLFDNWAAHHNKDDATVRDERAALQKLLNNGDRFNLQIMGVFDRSRLIAFTINELLPQGYAIGHFHKADHTYKGIFDFVVTTCSQYASDAGCRFLNIEMDLGILALRQAKRQLRPVSFLRKLTVARAV